MNTTLLLLGLCSTVLSAQAQLFPTSPAPLREHLLEVNEQWRVMDPSPEGGEHIVRFENEAQRIAAHLHRVAAHLRAHAPEGLAAQAMASRNTLLDRLSAYADRGLFPKNDLLPYRNPVFIDQHGTACAVGQLMIESGDRALAERISREMNLHYVHDMKRDDAYAWAGRNGFTEDELAWIQPAYSPNHDWLPLGGGTDARVTELYTLSNGDLLVAGAFTDAGGTSCTMVARWDGSTYAPLGAGVDGEASCAIEFGGQLYLGGSFQVGFQDLAVWNGVGWTYQNAFNGKYVHVHDLHVFNGELYAAGYAMGFAGATHQVLKKDGASWLPVGQAFDSDVYALADHYGQLVCGGDFVMGISPIDPLLNHVAVFDGTGWIMLADGLDATVYDLHSFDQDLYAGGECRVDSLPTFGFARLGDDVANWEHLMPNQTGYLDYFGGACRVNTIDDANGEVFVGGAFTLLGLMYYGNNLMRFWGLPDAFDAWALNDGPVLDIEQRNGLLVMGGEFQTDQSVPVPYVGYTELATGIHDPAAAPTFSISPNPAEDHIVVQLIGATPEGGTLEVTDEAGRTVMASRVIGASITRVDIGALSAGTYLLRLSTPTHSVVRSFVKR